MKKTKKMICFSSLVLPVLLVLNIYYSIPANIVLPEETDYTLKLGTLCSIDDTASLKTVASTTQALAEETNHELKINTAACGNYEFSVKLLGSIPIKNVHVTVMPKTYLIPSGETVGIKLYADGLMVVALSDVTCPDGTQKTPAKDAGIKKGDRILAVNGETVNSSEDFVKHLNQANVPLNLQVKREETVFDTAVTPAISAQNNLPRLGMWVRDSTAGIGTLTFYNPQTNDFGALGHAITDADTGDVIPIRSGNLLTCRLLSVKKGAAGEPGELVGSFSDKFLGNISKNTELGIFGTLANPEAVSLKDAMEVATRYQIKEGPASILADVDGNGVQEYCAEILKVSSEKNPGNKGLVIHITDASLLAKAGGIVQGMSGSPILQNGRIVGAVTHVFVNDPTRGYGIFIENMLAEAEKIK